MSRTGVGGIADLLRDASEFQGDGDGPEPLPASWLRQRSEPIGPGERRWLGILARTGTRIDLGGEHDVVRVLYVREDARRALFRDYAQTRDGGGIVPDPEVFRPIIGRPAEYGGPTDLEERERWAELLAELHGVEAALGGGGGE